MSKSQYTYDTRFDEEDQIFVATVQEFPLLAAHGETEEEALREIQEAVGAVIEDIAEKVGQPSPD